MEQRIKERPLAVKIGASLLVVAAMLAFLFGGPTTLRPECLLYSHGGGTCTFTNDIDKVISGCGHAKVFCGKIYERYTKKSVEICSGDVQPGESKVVEFKIEEFDQLVERYGENWRGVCDFAWDDE